MSLLTEAATAPPALGPYRLRDYDQLPDQPRHELVFGRLYVTPSPFPPHQVVSEVLGRLLGRIADAADGLVFHAPLDVVLADHSVVQPDLIYFSAARLPIAGDRIEATPDLVVEILSPSTASYDRSDKQHLYAFSGVKEYWLVDQERRQIEFLIYEAGNFVAAGPITGRYRSRVTPEIELDVSQLWQLVDAKLRLLQRGR
ncbi:MAG TPA: Uma2 family endonuclease [Thermoanaerobaculia bacterium]|nr:Uma2 family endonuclease [Thermoanaerobaculia bacterium]